MNNSKAKRIKKRANSRDKGARGEREFAEAIREVLGISARRGRQYNGLEGEDVVHELDSEIHFEVKRTEKLRLYEGMGQAVADAGDRLPLLCHRRNRETWWISLRLEDLPRLAELIASLSGPSHPSPRQSEPNSVFPHSEEPESA